MNVEFLPLNVKSLYLNFNKQKVRVMVDEVGDFWYVARDVAKVLGYRSANELTRQVYIAHKGERLFERRAVSVLNKGGLYYLTYRSRKPIAKRFMNWVNSLEKRKRINDLHY